MPIDINCSGCGQRYQVPDSVVGKLVRCKKCGSNIAVEAPAADEEVLLLHPVPHSPPPKIQTPTPKKKSGHRLDDLLANDFAVAPVANRVLGELPSASKTVDGKEPEKGFALPMAWLVIGGSGAAALLLVVLILAILFSGGDPSEGDLAADDIAAPSASNDNQQQRPKSKSRTSTRPKRSPSRTDRKQASAKSQASVTDQDAQREKQEEPLAASNPQAAPAERKQPQAKRPRTPSKSRSQRKPTTAKTVSKKQDRGFFPSDPQRWINSPPLTDEAMRGKAAFLYFFEESCPTCQRSWPGLIKLLSNTGTEPIAIVVVNSGSSRSSIEKYVRRNKIPWPVLVDPNRSFEKRLKVPEISLKNILQVRFVTVDRQVFSGHPQKLGPGFQRALRGAHWEHDITELPKRFRRLVARSSSAIFRRPSDQSKRR